MKIYPIHGASHHDNENHYLGSQVQGWLSSSTVQKYSLLKFLTIINYLGTSNMNPNLSKILNHGFQRLCNLY